MLAALNNIFQKREQGVLCFVNGIDRAIQLEDFRRDISKMIGKVESVAAQSYWVYTTNSYHFLVGVIALLMLNKKVVVCANDRSEWIASIADEFDAVMSEQHYAQIGKPAINFDLETFDSNRQLVELSGAEELLFFTSGSSGSAKASSKSLSQITQEVLTLEKAFGNELNNAVIASSVSHLHIYGFLFKLIWPLCCGRLWINSMVEYPEQLIALRNKQQSLVLVSSPAFLSRLDSNLTPIELSAIFSSGGPLSFSAANLSLTLLGYLPLEVYGSTETGGIAYRRQDSSETAWIPFEGINITQQLDESVLTSPHLKVGEKFILDDRLSFEASGSFSLIGRKDRVIKLEEKRVSLTEIERYLENMEEITRCIALLVPGKRQQIGCVLVLSVFGKQCVEQIGFTQLVNGWKNKMENRFERITIPRKWRHLESIPVNSQSKVDISSLLTCFKK